MKITSKLLYVMVEVPVQVGELKCMCEVQICKSLNEENKDDELEIEMADVNEVTYMGVPIQGYANFRKFKQFHLEMGIDWSSALANKLEEMQDEIKELVNASY
jgi:hypothetical protein